MTKSPLPLPNRIIFILLLFLMPLAAKAFHIIGGEITYECLNGNNYRIKLTVYRDCHCVGCAEFDNPAYLAVYNNTTGNYQKLQAVPTIIEGVEPPDIICIETLPDICVHQAQYIYNTTLSPFASEGYTLVYQRYSRNETIDNLILPEQTGSSYTAQIPPIADAVCNDSPVFNSFPPTVICAGTPILIDQSASDADGDSLVYALCDPLIGGSDICPQPGDDDSGCGDIPPPPYDTVNWATGFSADNPLGGNEPLTIDPQTGMLSGNAPNLGQYVVGICVSEYRDGVLINTLRRDFQFNVADCVVVLAGVEADSLSVAGDYYITDCADGYDVQFINNSVGGVTYAWDFGDLSTTTDVSNLVNPTYEYPDTGTYNVQLIAYGPGAACRDTAQIILKLYPILAPNFSYLPQCANTPLQFTDLSTTTYGQIDSWSWNFVDNITSVEQNPTFQFGTGGTYNVSLTVTTDLGCERTITQPVTVYPLPVPNFTTTTICPGVPVTFTDQSTNALITNWQWDFGDPISAPNNTSTAQNPTHTYNTAGAYNATLTVTSEHNCTNTQIVPFTVYNYFVADAGQNGQTCAGVPIQLTATDEYNWFSYQWAPINNMDNPTAQNPIVAPLETTIYTVTVSDPNGCTDSDNVTVTVNPVPNVEIVGDTTICENEATILNGIVGNGIVSYNWAGGELSNNSSLSVSVSPNTNPTIYTLSVLNQYNCTNTDSITLHIIYPISPTATGDADICEGESVQLTASGGDIYNWQPPTGLDNPNIANPIATPNTNTTYTVTIGNECFNNNAAVQIIVHPLPVIDAGPNQTINVGESTQLNGISDNEDHNFTWSPDLSITNTAILTPTVSPLYSTTYLLEAISPYGCATTDSLRIDVTNIFQIIIPNAFSPNGDGVNDNFGIVHTKGLKSIDLFRIYNRWGQVIFESNNELQTDWDGTHKGIEQEMGVYVYYIEASTFLGEPFQQKGNVTLVR